MAKPLKVVLWIVGIFFALIAGAVLAVSLAFDPNDYRDEIAKGVKDGTGRDLTLGNLDLNLFPWLGVSVSEASLSNAEGFGPEPFVKVGEVEAGVRLLPLLIERAVRIGTVRVHGLQLNLAQTPQANNWTFEGTEAKDDREDSKPVEPPPEGDVAIAAVEVGGLDLRNARVTFRTTDAAGKSVEYRIENLNLETGPLRAGEPVDLALSLLAKFSEPELEADLKFAVRLAVDEEQQAVSAENLDFELAARGEPVPGGNQSVRLRGGLRFEQASGTLDAPNLELAAAGLTVQAAVRGEGLTGEKPALSGQLTVPTFSPRNVAAGLGVALPATTDGRALTTAKASARYAGTFSSATLDNLSLTLDDTTFSGKVEVADFATQAVAFALKADTLDADRYLPPPAPEGAEKKQEGSAEDFRSTELPVALLDTLNVTGTLDVGSLKVKGAQLKDVAVKLDAPKGKVKTQELTAQLYGGRLVQSARITPGDKPAYDLKAALEGVQSGSLLQDVAGKNYLSGLGNLNLGITSGGTTVGDLLKGLNGALATSFLQGAIEGFNMKRSITEAKALYHGQPMPASDEPKRTKFSDLKGSGKFVNGVFKTEALNARGDDYTLTGGGDVDVAGLRIDYVLKPTYTGGADLKDLHGLTIPVSIKGDLTDPKVRVDLETALKDKAKQKVTEEVKKQEDKLKEKLGDKLGDVFKKKK